MRRYLLAMALVLIVPQPEAQACPTIGAGSEVRYRCPFVRVQPGGGPAAPTSARLSPAEQVQAVDAQLSLRMQKAEESFPDTNRIDYLWEPTDCIEQKTLLDANNRPIEAKPYENPSIRSAYSALLAIASAPSCRRPSAVLMEQRELTRSLVVRAVPTCLVKIKADHANIIGDVTFEYRQTDGNVVSRKVHFAEHPLNQILPESRWAENFYRQLHEMGLCTGSGPDDPSEFAPDVGAAKVEQESAVQH